MSKPGVVPERLAQLPPSISLDSPLLSSLVALPAKAQVAYAVFTPVDSAQHLNAIESARRHLVSANAHLPILECLLPSVQVTRHSQSLHVFAISSVDNVSNPHAKLNSLCFDGLVGKWLINVGNLSSDAQQCLDQTHLLPTTSIHVR